MNKVDFRKMLPDLYYPKNVQWQQVVVPSLNFLMIDGQGDPNSSADYQQAVQLLYGASFKIKFFSKLELGRDYTVPPLEGLWFADDLAVFEAAQKDAYKWTMMIMQPQWLTAAQIQEVLRSAQKKTPVQQLDLLRFESYSEGESLQLLHVGSYDEEAPKLSQLHHQIMPQLGLTFNGLHHEIYLSDPRKTAPERLRTILRQPVRAV